MTDAIPSFAKNLVHDYAQKALTAAATYLTAHGFLDSAQSMDFVQAGVGVALAVVSIGWTLAANKLRQKKYRTLLNAPAPTTQS